LQRYLFYWAALTIFPLLVGLSFSTTAYFGIFKEVEEITEQYFPQGYNILPLILQWLAFFLLFKFLPAIRVHTLPAIGGALLSSILWEFLKKWYLLYASYTMNYNVVYGSLVALPLFMIWLFISWMAMLVGTEFAFAWQNFHLLGETRKRMIVPFRIYEILGLELLLEAAKRFIQGGPPLSLQRFGEEKALPADLVNSTADKLIASGMLKLVNSELILTRDPAHLSMQEILESIRTGGAQYPYFAQKDNCQKLRSFMDSLEEPSRQSKERWTLEKLLLQWEELGGGK
jgi:membrane protein